MSLSFSARVARRYLWSKRGEAFITIITLISLVGVAIGVVVINIAMAIMSGFEHELRSKLVDADSHIYVRQLDGKIEDWRSLVSKVKEVDGVDTVAPYTYNQALLRGESSSTGLLVRGIEPEGPAALLLSRYLEQKAPISQLLSAQQPKEDGAALPGIIVGRELLRTMGIMIGEPVALLSPQVGSSPMGLMPRFRRFIPSASYRSGLVQYESGMAYMNITDAQAFFRLGDAVSGLEIRVKEIDRAPEIATIIREKVGGFQSGYYTQDWTELNKPLWDALKLEKTVYFIVLLLIVVMASFSIISTLVLLVMEKRGDIAVMRTMGATERSVGNIFRIQGALIGASGTIIGLILGYLGCVALREYGFPLDERIFSISTVPVRIDPTNFLIVGIASFTICYLATIYPARRASRIEPAQVLRYE